jgi:hypothetical protein
MSTTSEVVMSPPLDKLFAALAKAQGEIEGASKDKVNPHFKSRYADLASIWDACRRALSVNGLSVLQFPLSEGELVGIRTILGHASGQSIESTVWTRPQQAGPQALGSCVTYLRRYALAAAVGVAPDDDDGEAASPREPERPPVPRANTVKATGAKASPEAVKKLHTLRGKVGGLVVCATKEPCPYPNGSRCGYHAQLAAFKDADGKMVTSSKNLSPEQIANLIERYERQIEAQAKRAETPPDIGSVMPASNVREQTKKLAMERDIAPGDILSVFSVDSLDELDEADAVNAFALVSAWGTDRYTDVLAQVQERVGMRA